MPLFYCGARYARGVAAAQRCYFRRKPFLVALGGKNVACLALHDSLRSGALRPHCVSGDAAARYAEQRRQAWSSGNFVALFLRYVFLCALGEKSVSS